MLRPGDKVPDFVLPVGYPDGRREDVAFASLLGRGPIVISFFPLAFTRVCTTQMCDMRDHASMLDAHAAQVFGFSCDSKWTNAKFAAQENMKHGIFSDANRHVVDALWETQTTAGVERVPKRGWMVIDPQGVVVDLHVTDVPGDPWVGTKTIEAALAKVPSPR
ncbi:MAG TPA: redoxin domain-containing protein [Candidatus Thermoplasmatota archaeon]|nr:redoxin domain-containing protein [Candidatus Thermoplasmatota archaeon]